MQLLSIAVCNQSRVLGTEDITQWIAVVQKQVSEHFAPHWGIDARLEFCPDPQRLRPDQPWVVCMDHTDQAALLGVLDVTPGGQPIGRVLARTDLDLGAEPSVSFSQEVLELLADPHLTRTFELQMAEGTAGAVKRLQLALEVCEPTAGIDHAYELDGVRVSNFVTPAWFEYWSTARKPFDFSGKISRPLELLSGGSMSLYDPCGGGWSILTHHSAPPRFGSRLRPGSRRERRTLPRHQWLRSPSRGPVHADPHNGSPLVGREQLAPEMLLASALAPVASPTPRYGQKAVTEGPVERDRVLDLDRCSDISLESLHLLN